MNTDNNQQHLNDDRHKTSSQPVKAVNENPEKDPEDWVTGNEPMTGPQRSYLHTLAREAGEEIDDQMTKADASKKIEELQDETGRGKE